MTRLLLLALVFCAGQASLFSQNILPVRFEWGTERFPENFKAFISRPDFTATESVEGKYYRYIQCSQIPSARQRLHLEESGMRFLGYVQFGAYLVEIPSNFMLSLLADIDVRSIVPVRPDWKIARSLRERPFGAWALHGDLVDIYLQLYPALSIPEGAARCRREGFQVLQEGTQNGLLTLRVPVDQLQRIAALPFVRYLELLPPPADADDDKGRAIHRTNLLDSEYASGLHYDGSGVRVLVRDDGPIGPHIDYQGRLENIDNTPAPFGDVNHADEVGSCVGSAGNLDPQAKGMAAGADLFAIHYDNSFQDQTLALHLDRGITITNTSYTEGCNLGYTTSAQTVDQQLFDHPTLSHVFSSGNRNGVNCNYGAGTQWGNISGGHKMSKNSIAVGNIAADGTLNNTSSRGPANDGRLKPEISAFGTNVYMTHPENTYDFSSGTSFSAPAVAGCLAQLTQAYRDLNSGELPEALLLKTAICNTAYDLGNRGPDFKFGWGLINTYAAYQLLKEHRYASGEVDQAATRQHTLFVPNGTRQVRIMVGWADPAANANAAKALINDLDLQLRSPLGAVYQPWKLDPTPDPVILNTPAATGRDSLNNLEQIVIDNPVAGTYTIDVKGFEVPFGPQAYLLSWVFFDDQVHLGYPAGGEALVPGEKTRIHWDAVDNTAGFTLEFSADNGQSWSTIANVASDQRSYDWDIPNLISGKCRIRVIRGGSSDISPQAFSIAPVPTDIVVEKVCPNSMTVSWTGINDTLSYDVFLLGEKYMELKGNTSADSWTFPIANAAADQWVSVRCAGGPAGRRAYAVHWPGELKNCQQQDDLGVRAVLNPKPLPIITCQAVSEPVTVRLVNEGQNPVSGAVLNYRINGNAVVSEALSTISPGDTLDYTFTTPALITQNGPVELQVWSTYDPEDALFNDTLRQVFSAVVVPNSQVFENDFETGAFPPQGWFIENPDKAVTWQLTNSPVVGPDGQPSNSTWLNCFDYQNTGEEDYLYMPPFDLSQIDHPMLHFALAYAPFDNTYSDSLRVDVFPACDLQAAPQTIWGKKGSALATTNAIPDFFAPDNKQDWRTEAVSLQQFAGQTVILRFASVNDFGNNMYLDNIGLSGPPDAGILSSADTICRSDTLVVTADAINPGYSYAWTFGAGAQPIGASGPGPHAVRYQTAGTKNIRLAISAPTGTDTIGRSVFVLGNPVAGFSGTVAGPTISFTNSSQFAETYLWDFGDNSSSTATNPGHTYASPGTFTVTLTANNRCNSGSSVNQNFTLDFVGLEDLPEVNSISLSPNPSTGNFNVDLDLRTALELQCRLIDAQGRTVYRSRKQYPAGGQRIPFENRSLPAGVYQLLLQTDRGEIALRVLIQ